MNEARTGTYCTLYDNKQMLGFAGKIDTNALASKLYLAYYFSLFQESVRQRRSSDAKWRNGERRGKAEERKMIEQLLSPLPPPRLFAKILFFALSPLSSNRQALLISGDQITSNRRSKRARSGYVLCIAFILNGNQKNSGYIGATHV